VVAGHEKSEIALEAIAVDDRGERRRSRLVRLDQNEVALSLGSVELEKIRQVLIYDWLRLQFWQHLLLLFLLLLLVHWLLLGHWLLFLLGDCPLMCHRLPSLVRLLLSFLARLKLQPVKVTLLSLPLQHIVLRSLRLLRLDGGPQSGSRYPQRVVVGCGQL